MKTAIINIMLLAGVTAMPGLSSCTTDEIDRLADETEKPADEAPQQQDKGYFISLNGEYGAEATVGTRAHVHTGKKTDRKPRFSTGTLPMTK